MLQDNSWDTSDAFFPELPATNDPRWRQATVRVQGQANTELRTYPDETYSNVILYVYTGDIVSVIRESRFEFWIAAKVGYKIGWLNIYCVNFTLTKVLNHYETPQTTTPALESEWWAETGEHDVPQELITSQVEAFHEDIEPSTEKRISSKDVNRIIRFLKGLGGRSNRRAAQNG